MKIDKLAFTSSTDHKVKDYWKSLFMPSYQISSFPYDYNEKTYKRVIDQYVFSIDNKLSEKILAISNNSLTKTLTILCTGITALLYRYTNIDEIFIGTSIFNQQDDKNLINTALVLKSNLKDQTTFKELLLKMREEIHKANENANYPIELIIEELGLSNTQEYPLFDVAVILENIQKQKYLKDCRVNLLFRMTLNENQNIEGVVEYNSNLYNSETIKVLVKHLELFIANSLKSIDTPLCLIDYINSEEKKEIIYQFNQTSKNEFLEDHLLLELFDIQVSKYPDKIALVYEDQFISYKSLRQLVNSTAIEFKKKGIKENFIIGILMQRSIDFIVNILAILKLGAIYLPIDKRYPNSWVKSVILDSQMPFLVADNLNKVADLSNIVKIIDGFKKKKAILNDFYLETSYQENAYVLYTSGSTGRPKGVLVKQKNLLNYIKWAIATYNNNETVDFPLFTSLSFDLTVTSIYTPLLSGNKLIIYKEDENPDGLHLHNILIENKADIIKLTPSHLRIFRDDIFSLRKNNLLSKWKTRIRKLIIGGENLESQLALDIYNLFGKEVEIYNEYGPTETTVGCIVYKYTGCDLEMQNVPIGLPIANTNVYVFDKNRQICPYGVTGELYIGGAGVSSGYINAIEGTADKFIPELFQENGKLYRTGDRAKLNRNGFIEFLGRIDSQVKINGNRIELGEIEYFIKNFKDITDAVVVLSSVNNSPVLIAYFSSITEINILELTDFLKEKLLPISLPYFYIKIDKIPLNTNGKIDFKQLPQPSIKRLTNIITPRNTLQEQLAKIWSDVLEVDYQEISIDSNFFELGGNSLKAIIILKRINNLFNIDLNFSELIKETTIAGISTLISAVLSINQSNNNTKKSELII